MTNQTLPTPEFKEFTKEDISNILSSRVVTQDVVDKANALANSEELSQTFKENLITFTSVLSKGSFTPAQYVSAVQFVSYRLMGHDIRPAWEKTFPDRYKTLLHKNTASAAIHSHASAYNKTKLVALITEQSLIPSYIINNGYFQEALNKSMEIIRDKDTSTKECNVAIKTVLEYTAIPDSLIGNKEEISDKGLDIIQQLAKAAASLAESKREGNRSGNLSVEAAARKPVYTLNEDGEVIND